MQVHEVMTSTVWSVEGNTTLAQAARLMARAGIGALPVLDGNRVIGLVTARDITVRGTAQGLSMSAPVSAVMSEGIHSCHADELAADVLVAMEFFQVRRMPVEDDEDRLVGIVSIGDLMSARDEGEVGEALDHIFDTSAIAA